MCFSWSYSASRRFSVRSSHTFNSLSTSFLYLFFLWRASDVLNSALSSSPSKSFIIWSLAFISLISYMLLFCATSWRRVITSALFRLSSTFSFAYKSAFSRSIILVSNQCVFLLWLLYRFIMRSSCISYKRCISLSFSSNLLRLQWSIKVSRLERRSPRSLQLTST